MCGGAEKFDGIQTAAAVLIVVRVGRVSELCGSEG